MNWTERAHHMVQWSAFAMMLMNLRVS